MHSVTDEQTDERMDGLTDDIMMPIAKSRVCSRSANEITDTHYR